MGCEGYVTIQRIGDGQHLLPEWAPRFVVHDGHPVAILDVTPNGRLYRTNSLRPYTAGRDVIDTEAVDIEGIEGPCSGRKVLTVPLKNDRGGWEKAIVVADLAWLDAACAPGADGSRNLPFLYSWESRIAIWSQFTPGLWVVTRYSESGVHDPIFYSFDIPKDCVSTAEVDFQLWT